MNALIIVTTTSDDQAELQKIANHLVEQNLAACCQISGPITSVYRWEEEIESSQEWTCTIKTLERFYIDVEQAIRKFHHYDTPQITAVKTIMASESYEKWVRDCLM